MIVKKPKALVFSLAMAEPRCFQTQLNSIMEIMSRAVVRQICKIVDSDLASLRLELERALHDKATLGDKMRVLESEVETLRRTRARAPRKSCRSVCIQTSEGSACPVSFYLYSLSHALFIQVSSGVFKLLKTRERYAHAHFTIYTIYAACQNYFRHFVIKSVSKAEQIAQHLL